MRLTFASEAKSLKRAEVPNARARILAIDDEPVILDGFRKILVLAGYSVDTVESGPEGLALVRSHDYDFVFTDLKMPNMDGTEVVKAVRHLRPDVDVAVITGFGTIESAVATMQYGALDYVQKPFTEDELVAFANRLCCGARTGSKPSAGRPCAWSRRRWPRPWRGASTRVPGGAFVSDGHVWARIDPGGQVWIGLDDFARKALRKVERIDLPAVGTARVRRGGLLFVVRRGDQMARFLAPLSGEITQLNPELTHQPGLVVESPYDRGWVCLLRPSDLSSELTGLRIGKPVIAWYQEEVARLRHEARSAEDGVCPWPLFQSKFLGPGVVKR